MTLKYWTKVPLKYLIIHASGSHVLNFKFSPPSNVATTLLLELGPGPTEVNGETVTEYFENGASPEIIVWGHKMIFEYSEYLSISRTGLVQISEHDNWAFWVFWEWDEPMRGIVWGIRMWKHECWPNLQVLSVADCLLWEGFASQLPVADVVAQDLPVSLVQAWRLWLCRIVKDCGGCDCAGLRFPKSNDGAREGVNMEIAQ